MEKVITDPGIIYDSKHKYLGIFGMIWLTFLLLASITSIKTFSLFGLEFSVCLVAYPVTYIFADIFTEVYGYMVTRKIVWCGLFCLCIFSFFGYIYSIIPSGPSFHNNESFDLIFKMVPAIVILTLSGYFSGELVNSYVLAKLKLYTLGKFPEVRYVFSTIGGQFFDNSIFWVGLYFLTGFPKPEHVTFVILWSVVFCVFVEVSMLPVTRKVISWIKTKENFDAYDCGTQFSPFRF